MAETLEELREKRGSRHGFVLAAAGSAIGLGNLIPFAVATALVGVPMLVLEFSLGHVPAAANRPTDPREHQFINHDPACAGINTRTWSSYSMFSGDLNHIVPNCEFVSK